MSEIIDIKSKIKNINAVIGCKIGCRYCYAKAVAKRFHLTDDFSKPYRHVGSIYLGKRMAR